MDRLKDDLPPYDETHIFYCINERPAGHLRVVARAKTSEGCANRCVVAPRRRGCVIARARVQIKRQCRGNFVNNDSVVSLQSRADIARCSSVEVLDAIRVKVSERVPSERRVRPIVCIGFFQQASACYPQVEGREKSIFQSSTHQRISIDAHQIAETASPRSADNPSDWC